MSDMFDHELDAFEQADQLGEWGDTFYIKEQKREYQQRLASHKPTAPATTASRVKRVVVEDELISISLVGGWKYYRRKYSSLTPAEREIYRSLGDVTGKYLFFCQHREWLEELLKDEIITNGFMAGKISTYASGSNYVLCLYWYNDSRKWELAIKYKNCENTCLKYRFWKSDADTLAGKYSKIYKSHRKQA